MIFRTREARTTSTGDGPDVVLTMAEATFGRFADAIDGPNVMVGDRRFVFDPERSPAFVLLPTCDRCGATSPERFPLDARVIDGALVWAQTQASCRNCRFIFVASAPDAPTDLSADPVIDSRVHERRFERRARRRARRDNAIRV